jgi:hypothetical protein
MTAILDAHEQEDTLMLTCRAHDVAVCVTLDGTSIDTVSHAFRHEHASCEVEVHRPGGRT